MKSLEALLRTGRTPRAIGFDDSPFDRHQAGRVGVSGIVTHGTRFEGMVYGTIEPDGRDATDRLCKLLLDSKFGPQVHVVLTDGLTMGGLNVLDLSALHEVAGVPCVAVMRRRPDLTAFRASLDTQPDGAVRWETIQRAGSIHELDGFVFQVVGETPTVVARTLATLTDRGRVPEPLRLAHLIGSAFVLGQSGKRA